jgi:2-(1,2-epoxy-1,2-dihydrophenyl)acetyl-CoA isomerase
MEHTEDRVALTVEDGLAHLRLVSPGTGNAIDPAWVKEFADAVESCAQRADVRAVLISADGRAFTVGGDLRHFATSGADLRAALAEVVAPYHAALGLLATLDRPVVCAVQGPAAGGGLGITFCADIVLAASDARFVCGFARIGLSGDGAGTWFLPRLVGLRRAQELMFARRELSAQEALEWGLITRVVAADELDEEARTLARELAAGPTIAFASMRRLLRDSWGATLEQQLERERQAMVSSGGTADGREGVEAFLARRKPRFAGR